MKKFIRNLGLDLRDAPIITIGLMAYGLIWLYCKMDNVYDKAFRKDSNNE
jgi:hypothetical protein